MDVQPPIEVGRCLSCMDAEAYLNRAIAPARNASNLTDYFSGRAQQGVSLRAQLEGCAILDS